MCAVEYVSQEPLQLVSSLLLKFQTSGLWVVAMVSPVKRKQEVRELGGGCEDSLVYDQKPATFTNLKNTKKTRPEADTVLTQQWPVVFIFVFP